MTRLLGVALRLGLCAVWIHVGPPAYAQEPDPPSALTWLGREEAIERFIIEADVVAIEEIGTGVTNPKVADLAPGGPVERISFKPIRPGRYRGYWESYQSEIAAYELDKLLQLGMTPPTVEKRIERDVGAATMWASPTRSFKDFGGPPSPPSTHVGWWNYQLIAAKMFHNLINNKDPNMGNWLVDPSWNIILIDNSRAFTSGTEMVHPMTRIARDLWDRMLALDEDTLTDAVGEWLSGGERRAVLERRDVMAALVQEMVDARGEADVFVRMARVPDGANTDAGGTAGGEVDLDRLAQRLVDAVSQTPVALPASEFMWIGQVKALATYTGPHDDIARAAVANGYDFGLETEQFGLLGLTRDLYDADHYDRVIDLAGGRAEIFGMLVKIEGLDLVRVTRGRAVP